MTHSEADRHRQKVQWAPIVSIDKGDSPCGVGSSAAMTLLKFSVSRPMDPTRHTFIQTTKTHQQYAVQCWPYSDTQHQQGGVPIRTKRQPSKAGGCGNIHCIRRMIGASTSSSSSFSSERLLQTEVQDALSMPSERTSPVLVPTCKHQHPRQFPE